MKYQKTRTLLALVVGLTSACAAEAGDGRTDALRSGQEAPPAQLDCPPGPVGPILVEFACDSLWIETCRELSNVVLEFADGSRQKFDDLKGHTGEFAGTGEHEGKEVVRVWVKAGGNLSGEGPGYGTRFDAPDDVCTPAEPPAEEPPAEEPPAEEPPGEPDPVEVI